MIEKAFIGTRRYWGWIALLLVLVGVGFIFYLRQWSYGLGITGMSRDVSWGLYIANFTFFVGVAASAVMVVLPYYLHNYKQFGKITVLGEFLAVAAVLMCVLFIFVDLGQPARVFNIMTHPSISSILFWDMIVLSVYLLLNVVIAWYTLDSERKSEPPRAWVKPLILISIPWAISIHTVTAFIYCGLGARPLWHTALWAPRFLSSAFASGPALLIMISLIIKRFTKFDPGWEAIQKVAQIVTYAMIINIFFISLETFTILYGKLPEHVTHYKYLHVGLEGRTALVPWMWTSMILGVIAIILLINPGTRKRERTLVLACVALFVSIWIDKGLGLVVPGFIPSPTGEIFEYMPTVPEALITLGVWAFGFLVLTVLYKVAIFVKQEISV